MIVVTDVSDVAAERLSLTVTNDNSLQLIMPVLNSPPL